MERTRSACPARSVVAGTLKLCVPLLVVLLGAGCDRPASGQKTQVGDGAASYARNCAVCHGASGRGDGPAAYLLEPRPRDFGRGAFRLVSSKNGVARVEDLVQTITRGMPGTAMPSWTQLPEAERRALAEHVLGLWRAQLIADGLGRKLERPAAEASADKKMKAGEEITPPPAPASLPAAEVLKASFVTTCAGCHAEDGTGRDDPNWRTAEGHPIKSRNFVRGVFKGGRDDLALYRRIAAGMPGTPMPSFATLPPEEIWKMVRYIQSLAPAEAQEAAWVQPAKLVAARRPALPADAADAAWQDVPATRMATLPLFGRPDAVAELTVRALHDGKQLALLLEWPDPQADTGVGVTAFSDAAAVQLAAALEPPLFTMGEKGKPVQLWHWKAVWDGDAAGQQEGPVARAETDGYYADGEGFVAQPKDDTQFQSARAAGNSVAQRGRGGVVEEASAEQFGSLTPAPPEHQAVRGAGVWGQGRWRVVLRHTLAATARGDVALLPGKAVSVGFAVWQGALGDRNGQKSVTLWNRLELAP